MNSREVDRLGIEIPRLLAGLIGGEAYSARVLRRSDAGFDLEVRTAGRVFAVELKQSSAAVPLAAAVRTIGLKMRKAERNRVPLLVVPFMGEVGRKICEEAGLGWFDLSGNASIVAPGIRIVVKGNRNRFRSAGRPANIFAPKSSRIARWLLMHPEDTRFSRVTSQLAQATCS